MGNYKYISIILFGLVLNGCDKSLDSNSYIRWFDSNDKFLVEKEMGDLTYSIQYRNGLYNFLKSEQNTKLTDSLMNSLEKSHSFFIKISSESKDLENTLLSESKFNYVLSEISRDFRLANNKDTLPCKFHHLERAFDITNSLRFVTLFDYKLNSNSDMKLIYDDHIFNSGTQIFTFTSETINSIPKLTKT